MSAEARGRDVPEQTLAGRLPVPRVNYEVSAKFVELVDPEGHRHWLTQGQDVPSWADPKRVAQLAAAGALMTFERLGNG